MTTTARILAVDRNQRNLELLTQFLSTKGFQLVTINGLEQFDRIFTTAPPIQAALIDISGFDRRIWTHCKVLCDRQIPFLILSSYYSSQIQQVSLAAGACRMLVKPLVISELVGLLQRLVEPPIAASPIIAPQSLNLSITEPPIPSPPTA
ncbi:response regulator [Egbenema bharatensis]|uniref:response regulator n=1 Tax=Egbenema bharatensis TaxID=3463334 RepID=UPI003A889E8E